MDTDEKYKSGFDSGISNPKAFTSEQNLEFRKGFQDGQIKYWSENSTIKIPEIRLKI